MCVCCVRRKRKFFHLRNRFGCPLREKNNEAATVL